MGYFAVIAVDRNLLTDPPRLDTAIGRLVGHNSHLDGPRHSPAPIDGTHLVATIHSTETAVITIDDTGTALTHRTGVNRVGPFATPVPGLDAQPDAGPVDPDASGIIGPWTAADTRRALDAQGQPAPPMHWPDGPGRFLIAIREEATRDGTTPDTAVGDAVRQVLTHRGPPVETAIGHWGNAVWTIGFLPTGGQTTLIADTNTCLPAAAIAADFPDWWADIGQRLP